MEEGLAIDREGGVLASEQTLGDIECRKLLKGMRGTMKMLVAASKRAVDFLCSHSWCRWLVAICTQGVSLGRRRAAWATE